jgi:hypothetical protein
MTERGCCSNIDETKGATAGEVLMNWVRASPGGNDAGFSPCATKHDDETNQQGEFKMQKQRVSCIEQKSSIRREWYSMVRTLMCTEHLQ